MLAKPTSALLDRHLSRLSVSNFTRNYSSSTQFLSTSKPRNPIKHINTSRYLISYNSQITKNGRNGNLKEAESIFNRMPFRNVISWTAMLTAYAENGEITKARKVFDNMPQRNIASWNAMITAYIRNSLEISDAYELFSKMPERNSISHAAIITGFVQAGMLHEAKKVYSEMPLIGRDPVASNALISGYLKKGELEEAFQVFKGMSTRDVVSWSAMVSGYCKKGRIADAKELFDKMPERNVVSWTAMINGYMKMGKWEDGFELFLQMRREDVKINSTTLTIIFETCANLGRYREGIQVHGLVLSMGLEFDIFLDNSIINMYCRAGLMDAAKNVFDLMNKKDVVSWNSLISGYVQNDGIQEAYILFKMMPERDVVSWTAMIWGFSNMGRLGESIRLFEEMPVKDDVAWTAIISGFVCNGEYEEAFWWFICMLRGAIKPNALALSSILGASSGLASLNQGVQIHAHVLKLDMESDVSIQNSLISMYAKSGNLDNAHRIFTSIYTPNIVSMNSMITGFAQHGLGKEALELFKKMQTEGREPNQVTFLAVLSACAHMGLVEEGWDHFKSMSSLYQIEPGPDHYTCMVDTLGRAGFLKEAIDLIHSMPFMPNSAIWGALLSASKTHLDLDLAKLAAKHLFELEPESATAYVVLSNIYSIVGLKNDEEQLRLVKKSKGMKKNPGWSWIIVNNSVHLFFAGNQSHLKFEEIAGTLRRIAKKMRDLGCYNVLHNSLFD